MRRRVGSARVWKVSSCVGMYIQYSAYTGRVKPLADAFPRVFILRAFRRSSAAAQRPPSPDRKPEELEELLSSPFRLGSAGEKQGQPCSLSSPYQLIPLVLNLFLSMFLISRASPQ